MVTLDKLARLPAAITSHIYTIILSSYIYIIINQYFIPINIIGYISYYNACINIYYHCRHFVVASSSLSHHTIYDTTFFLHTTTLPLFTLLPTHHYTHITQHFTNTHIHQRPIASFLACDYHLFLADDCV